MSTHYKSLLYKQLRETGVPITRPYREWTMHQLTQALIDQGVTPVERDDEDPSEDADEHYEEEAPGSFFGLPDPAPAPQDVPQTPWGPEGPPVDRQPEKLEETTVVVSSQPDPNEMPGQRLNTSAPDDVIRIDEDGRRWHQEEVRKPAYPKPRGRRVLKYMDTGVRTETVKNGEYIETFEVSGVQAQRPAEVKITLPSYQVGIYTDPRFPFKIHCYNDREGFDFEEVQAYYGGSHLVPDTCLRIYIENDLCYDIRSVIRTIQTEHRQLQLMGKIQ